MGTTQSEIVPKIPKLPKGLSGEDSLPALPKFSELFPDRQFIFINSKACTRFILRNYDVVVGTIPVGSPESWESPESLGLVIDKSSWKQNIWTLDEVVNFLNDASKCYQATDLPSIHSRINFQFVELDTEPKYRINGFETIRELVGEYPYTSIKGCLYDKDFFGRDSKRIELPESVVSTKIPPSLILNTVETLRRIVPVGVQVAGLTSSVGQCTFIGRGSCIGFDVTIGKYCYIGMGAIISNVSVVPDGTVIPDGGRWDKF